MNHLYIERLGQPDKPAIIFLHGGGLSSRQWGPQMQKLASDFFCLAPDLPEQGRSAAVQPFTLSGAAEQVIELIQEIPSQRAHLVGLSLGGAVALEVARVAPERVDHLLVSGTSAGLSGWLGKITIWSAGLYRWFSQEQLLRLAYRQFNIPPQYQADLREDLLKGFDPAFTRHFTEALMQLQLPARANALVCVGERETTVARGDARKLVQRIAGARGVVVPKVGHVWNLEAHDLFTEIVRAFVRDQPLPDGLRTL